jgi:hypothetical protein
MSVNEKAFTFACSAAQPRGSRQRVVVMSPGVDLHEELFDAMHAFVKLTLLFHSASPWTFEKTQEWMKLQEPILKLQTRQAEALRSGEKLDATTKRLCDLGRAILG